MIRNMLNVVQAITAPAANAIQLDRAWGEWESLSLHDAGRGDFVTLSNGVEMHYIHAGRSRLRPPVRTAWRPSGAAPNALHRSSATLFSSTV